MNHISRLFLVAGLLFGVARLSAAESANMMKSEILSSYANISAALAADDVSAAKAAAATTAEHARMGNQNDIATKADAVAKAAKIEDARSAFKSLSTAVEPLAAGQKDFVVMHCPMVNADWVQKKGKTQNPYYGKAMLTCGGPKASK